MLRNLHLNECGRINLYLSLKNNTSNIYEIRNDMVQSISTKNNA